MLYYMRSDGVYCCDVGQTHDQIIDTCLPLTVIFIGKQEYQNYIDSIQPHGN